MADPLPNVIVTIDGTPHEFDVTAITGRQLGVIESLTGLTFEGFLEGIDDGTRAAVSAALFVAADQARGPIFAAEAAAVMDSIPLTAEVAFTYAETEPAEEVPAA